jgi:hypothetical protein
MLKTSLQQRRRRRRRRRRVVWTKKKEQNLKEFAEAQGDFVCPARTYLGHT